MAYSDYGAFVYLNGGRRTDKEDVGVYDTDEASLPSGLRIYANIMKHHGAYEWRNVRDKTAADCYRCIRSSRELFGNDHALCDLDCLGPGTWARLADLIEGKD